MGQGDVLPEIPFAYMRIQIMYGGCSVRRCNLGGGGGTGGRLA